MIGWATIVDGPTVQIEITSNPKEAVFEVKDPLNNIIKTGKTPQTISLQRSDEYNVVIKMDGYKESTFIYHKNSILCLLVMFFVLV